ncbi:hypothetical protein [Rhizobium leguminosarum]|uniref:hypothetical protein n=1 Tax=Rhizobium leguminosarum TaxID=384 RepID=UPI00102FEC9F|nr:hypothetical protein [Rhizobium leguminosarum]TAX38535.1 hypothetical protein ELI05_06035 [Rhizobium leguminosarum]
MKANERLVYFFEVQVKTNKDKASPPPLGEVIEKIIEAFQAGEASLQLNRKSATVEIVEVRMDPARQIVTFFLRCADKNGADVYFANPELGQSRVERKREGEGRAFGAHFSVSLTPREEGGAVYGAMLEKANNLSSTIVARLFQSILRRQYQANPNLFTCDDISGARTRDGHPKQVGFRPMLELSGLPSDQFIADLEEGTLKEVQLIEQHEERQVGARPWLVEDQKVIRLTAKSGGVIPGLWNDLTGLFAEKAQNGISRARIKFKRSDGQLDTVDIDPETGGLLDQRYVKAKKISEIDPPMDECSDGIVEHFAAIVEAELIENR